MHNLLLDDAAARGCDIADVLGLQPRRVIPAPRDSEGQAAIHQRIEIQHLDADGNALTPRRRLSRRGGKRQAQYDRQPEPGRDGGPSNATHTLKAESAPRHRPFIWEFRLYEHQRRWRAVFVLRRQSAQDRRGSGNPLPLLGEGWRVITTSRN